MYSMSKKVLKFQMNNFRMTISDARGELEVYQSILKDDDNISEWQAKHAETSLKLCLDLIDELTETADRIESSNAHLWLRSLSVIMKERSDEFDEQAKDLHINLEKLDDAIGCRKEVYKKTNMVPRNPTHIVLDVDDETTVEGKLKAAIFCDQPNDAVTVLARGMGGIGKTCALRACGLHDDVSTRFPDGVFHMQLGVQSDRPRLIKYIASFVKKSGGERKYKEVEAAEDLRACVSLAAKWFGGRICLFLIDDVCCQNGIDSSVSEVLAGLAAHAKSKVAFTTRDNKLKCDKKIKFRKRTRLHSEKIILRATGLDAPPTTFDGVFYFERVLEIADGHPAALHVIGSRAKHYMEDRKLKPMSVWIYMTSEYKQKKSVLQGNVFHNERTNAVSNVLLQSFTMIDNRIANNQSRKLFAALAVLGKRQETPIDVLQRVWGMNRLETKDQMRQFERFNLVDINMSYQGHTRDSIIVHDLQLEMAEQLAEKQEVSISETSRRVLFSYVSDYESELVGRTIDVQKVSNGSTSTEEVASGKMELNGFSKQQSVVKTSDSMRSREEIIFHETWIALEDDEFAIKNLFRLLSLAGMHDKGFLLLSDPRWLCKQMMFSNWKQVDDEFLVILQHMQENNELECTIDDITFLEMLRAALIEGERYIAGSPSPGMILTQLYGRLYRFKDYPRVAKFLQDVERFAPRTKWLKSDGMFPGPTPVCGKVLTGIRNVVWLREHS